MTADQFPLFRYRGTLRRVVDGDTAYITLDLGFDVAVTHPIRIVGVNAPEVHGPHRDLAARARDALGALLAGKTLYLATLKGQQTFARYLAAVYYQAADGTLRDVAEEMKAAGYDVPRGQ